MSGRRRRIFTVAPVPLVVFVALAVLVAISSNAASGGVSHAGDTDGVTPTSIRVGALASMSGFASSDFAPVVTGAQIYFDAVNAAGGVDGRKILYGPKIDDGTSPNGDSSGALQLVQSRVFAVVGVGTPFFTGSSILQAHAVPTFGLQENSNAQWAGPNMFGAGGSYISFTAPQPQAAYIAQIHHARRAAVLAYNVVQSSEGCISVTSALHAYGIPTPVIDTSIPYGAATLDADVTRMQQNGVDFVATCMDATGNIKLSQTLQQHGMSDVTQYWLDGYNQQTLDNNRAAMDGVYLLVQQTPFEVAGLDPGRYPGMDRLVAALHRFAPGTQPSVPLWAGWVSADLFVTGLGALGHDVTRSGLVTVLNRLDAYNADGAMAPVDWTVAHTSTTSLNCTVFVRARGTTFVPVFGTPPSVYSCFAPPGGGTTVERVPLSEGVPGR